MRINELMHECKERYIHNKKTISKKKAKDLSILLLNAPCNGFGDIVFAMKLASYIKKWYHVTPMIASTQIQHFINLGEDKKNMIKLETNRTEQCRRFENLKLPSDLPVFDVILVAPMQADYNPSLHDVQQILPYATYLNTLFFSEYNDDMDKGFDFNIGIGNGRDGIFLDSFETDTSLDTIHRLKLIPHTYAVVYIAELETSYTCMYRFIEMIVKQYKDLPSFEIVVPKWTVITHRLIQLCKPYFDQIDVITKDEKNILYENGFKNKLTFRKDIFPLPYKDTLSLYKYSVREILVTGDQSISDVIGCCDKLPFYQIVPWKKDFSKQLAALLPQKFIKSVKTSCGSLEAIHYHPNARQFIETQNFSKIGKPKLDALLRLIHDYKNM